MYWGFVIAGYLIVFSTLAAYILWVLYRGRELARQVPEDRRRYLDSEAAGHPATLRGLGLGRGADSPADPAGSPVRRESPVGSESDLGRDSGFAP